MKYTVLFLILIGLPLYSYDLYSTVAEDPKLAVEEGQFAFYWALWRRWDNEDEMLVSKRTLSWEATKCGTEENVKNGETFWYLDLGPIREAYRENHLYLVLVNFNSLYAKGQGGYVAPLRHAKESFADYTKRKSASYKVWKAAASIRNWRGSVTIDVKYRVYPNTVQKDFLMTKEYESSEQMLYSVFLPFRSDRWPFFWDERAHKAHTINEPSIWNAKPFSEDSFFGRFEWNWCENELKAKLIIPKGTMPPPGPNRVGRPSTVSYPYQVREE